MEKPWPIAVAGHRPWVQGRTGVSGVSGVRVQGNIACHLHWLGRGIAAVAAVASLHESVFNVNAHNAGGAAARATTNRSCGREGEVGLGW